ncbi:MAG TPA: hypothetical protein VKU39_21575 [Streptosporangiaceae bacterium]|nr:hypothetical protein [Streptosporangiaceae bacterium]
MDGNSQQEAVFASTRGTLPAGSAQGAKETLDQRYLRQTRNAVVVIAIAACLPYGIWAVYHLTH